jgi:hypothetical protein
MMQRRHQGINHGRRLNLLLYGNTIEHIRKNRERQRKRERDLDIRFGRVSSIYGGEGSSNICLMGNRDYYVYL